MFTKGSVYILFFMVFSSVFGQSYNLDVSRIVLDINPTAQELEASIMLKELIYSKTHKSIPVLTTTKSSDETQEIVICLKQNEVYQSDKFCISKKENKVTINAKGVKMLVFATRYFFDNYFLKKTNFKELKEYCETPDFTYRAPYFSQVVTTSFAKENCVHRLDEYWGVWGHNLDKVLKKHEHSNQVYATINGKLNKHQYCFSSSELQTIIEDEITYLGKKLSYVIAPKDNGLVCTCNQCLTIGNTKTDASASVFTLLKKLAENNKEATFFTLVYQGVKNVPKFSLPDNVGVFLSTIEYQNAVPFEKMNSFFRFKDYVARWNKQLNTVYIWDYVLNYDNYNDFYPVLKTTQSNLKFYKELGVSGVFFNGSEVYSIAQELKSYVLSKLLWNTNADVETLIKEFCASTYPSSIAKLLADYYISIERKGFNSKHKHAIYAGVLSAKRKYLDKEMFQTFFKSFAKEYSYIENPNLQLKKLYTSLIMLHLENSRLEMKTILLSSSSRDSIKKLLHTLEKLSIQTNEKYYNESKHKVREYITNWLILLEKYPVELLLPIIPKKVLSKLDEGYPNINMLYDGSWGFSNDYQTNWLILSKDDLKLEYDARSFKKDEVIHLSFLQDVKHKIYFPTSISLYQDGKLLEKINWYHQIKDGKKEVIVSLKKIDIQKSIFLKIDRNIKDSKSALACDEIYLRKL